MYYPAMRAENSVFPCYGLTSSAQSWPHMWPTLQEKKKMEGVRKDL